MQKRMVLAIVLSFIVVFVYQYFFAKNLATNRPDEPQRTKQAAPAEKSGPAVTAAPVAAAPAASPKSAVARKPAASAKDVRVDTPLYSAVFTTQGGALKSFKLKEYRKSMDGDTGPVDIVQVQEGQLYPLSTRFSDSSFDIPADLNYEASASVLNLVEKPGENRLVFSATFPREVRVERIFTFDPARYAMDLEIRVTNLSAAPIHQNAYTIWSQFLDPKVKLDKENEEGAIAFVKDTVHQDAAEKIEAKKVLGPDVSWAGFESKYFLASLISKQPTLTSYLLEKDASGRVYASLEGPKNLIPPAQSGVFSYTVYLGPKVFDLLKAQGVGLENAINFGSWIKWLAMPLLIVMNFLYQYVHNYGTAIIILTILTKIIFWPLGNKSYKSMKEMQVVQPKIKELQERYKNDKQALNQAVMELYKTHKINPLGGCLPILIQIPVFFGLYRALLYAIELRHAPFFGWIQDLSAKDPYYITPVIMGATMFIQQKMSPPMRTDPMQQKIMLLMPIIFTALFLNFPSGLVIYWLFNNILSIGQQYYINKAHNV